MEDLSYEKRVYFRDQLREARATALRDAEDFRGILFALERLGSVLAPNANTLRGYETVINELAIESPLAEDTPSQWREWHIPFSRLYDLVRKARNDALHQGAYARHLTTHAIQLCLVLEDALMSGIGKVSDYMVRDVICASEWQPISLVRQQMLENSFTYLPISRGSKWYLISDASVAKYLPRPNSQQRKERLAQSLEDALKTESELAEEAKTCFPHDSVEHALTLFQEDGRPVLVLRDETPKYLDTPNELLGILTAFDLL